jgi:hypothetical protein
LQKLDKSWHICVDSICLDSRGKIGVVLTVMHDVNK